MARLPTVKEISILSPELPRYWCPPDEVHGVAVGGFNVVEQAGWVGLNNEGRPAEEWYEGAAWIVLNVVCVGD